MVLVLVLVVLTVLTMGAFSFADRMLTERRAARIHGRQTQSRALADSGVEMLKQFLAQDFDTRIEQGGTYDNPTRFRAQMVTDSDDPRDRGYFTVVSPKFEQDDTATGIRYGMENESARFNLNTLIYMDTVSPGAGHTLLMTLPAMTDDIADSILYWLDPNATNAPPRGNGATADYYSGLSPPYAPKNGPLDSVEELLLVQGVTPELLFGVDANRNGVVDGNEAADSVSGASDNAGSMVRGWAGYLTLNSYESNLQPDGVTPRISLNENDSSGTGLTQLQSDLSTAGIDSNLASFIIAYRQFGPYTGKTTPSSNASITVDPTQAGKVKFTSVLDLVDAKVQLKTTANQASAVVASPITSTNLDALDTLLDMATAVTAQKIPGRININQAPKTLLMGIPGMTEDIADQIISKRVPEPGNEQPSQRHETWLLAQQVVPDLATMKALSPFITSGGDVYRGQVVGYFEEQGPASRFEVILDATAATPRIVFWRDITHLGRGYSLDALGTQATQ